MALGAQAALILLVLCSARAFAEEAKAARADPVQAAIGWIKLLKVGDAAKLAGSSRLPFVQRGFDDCPAKDAATAGDLTVALNCVAHSKPLFVESIPNPTDAVTRLAHWRVLKPSEVTRDNRKLARKLATAYTLVGGDLVGNGISYVVALAVAKDGGVSGILIDLGSYDDPN